VLVDDRSTESLLDKKLARKRCVLTEEKVNETGARLEHTPHKSLRGWQLKAVRSHSYGAF
jgi:hypothetical protein